MDLLDMRGRCEEHFPHTLLHRKLLVALLQGRQQLLMSLHNTVNVAHQLMVFFSCQTVPTYENSYNACRSFFSA